jgi:lycopene beta-cyclase
MNADIIIAGAGCAGLSLAWQLVSHGFTTQRIVLIDPIKKTTNDRTWCFWESQPGDFESVVKYAWHELDFCGASSADKIALDIKPYAYKMIRSADFYGHIHRQLAQYPNVVHVNSAITSITSASDGTLTRGALVETAETTYRAKLVFNSIPNLLKTSSNTTYHHLIQHFVGWFIKTAKPVFTPQRALLMDYRVPQHNDTRFVYVLPFDQDRALVEFTVFSPNLLPKHTYDLALRDYLRALTCDYEIEESEFGAIPMTDAPFERNPLPHVINIGGTGGMTKASTGYTFQRIQCDIKQIVQDLIQCQNLLDFRHQSPYGLKKLRFQLYDAILLNVLSKHRYMGHRVFTDLFERNRAAQIFKFLDEDTTMGEDLRIMASVNLPSFIKAALDVIKMRITRKILAR